VLKLVSVAQKASERCNKIQKFQFVQKSNFPCLWFADGHHEFMSSIQTLPRAMKLDTLVVIINAIPIMAIIDMLPVVTMVTAFW
jgi:hypothetical protein